MLSTIAGIDTLVARTSVTRNKPLEDELVVWIMELFTHEVSISVTVPTTSRDQFAVSINRYLCKKRLVNYLCHKCKGLDSVTCESSDPPTEPASKMIATTLGTFKAFRESGLAAVSCATLPWLTTLSESRSHSPVGHAEALNA